MGISCTDTVVVRIDRKNLEQLTSIERAKLNQVVDAIYRQSFSSPSYTRRDLEYLPLVDGMILRSNPNVPLQHPQRFPFLLCRISDANTIFTSLKYNAKRELRSDETSYRVTNCVVAYFTKDQIEGIPDGDFLVSLIPLEVEIFHYERRVLVSSYVVTCVFFASILLFMRFSHKYTSRIFYQRLEEAQQISSPESKSQVVQLIFDKSRRQKRVLDIIYFITFFIVMCIIIYFAMLPTLAF